MEETIKEFLEEEYNNYIRHFSTNKILGTFLVGKGNYGFAKDASDLHFITIYLPSFEELCIGPCNLNIESCSAKGKAIDIRQIYRIAKDVDNNLLELLFTNYYIITPKYKKIFEDSFLSQRDIIANYNRKDRLFKARNNAMTAFLKNDYFEGIRLFAAASLYSRGVECDKCFHIEDPFYKSALNMANDFKTSNFSVEDISAEMQTLIDSAPEETNFKAANILKSGVVNLMTKALHNSAPTDSFEECLTTREKEAWDYIKKDNVDGNISISISKMIEQTGISRPIWKNLLNKLEKNNIAEIINKGAKGTVIKLSE